MKNTRKLIAVLLTLLLAAAGAAAEMDSQERYWIESGRAALSDILYNGRGTTLTASERDAFFRRHAVQMEYCYDYPYGAFTIYSDGTFSGEAGEYREDTYFCTAFVGRFTNVIRLTSCVYALQTNDIDFYQEDFPEAMQSTMLLTVPGVQAGQNGALNYEIRHIADRLGVNPAAPLQSYFLTAFDSAPLWYSSLKTVSSGSSSGTQNTNGGSNGNTSSGNSGKSAEIYGLATAKLSTRKGPGTQYKEGGTYNVKGQYIRILSRAYDDRNGIWWVKCEIPYKKQTRVLWTGWKRFDHNITSLESIPIDPEY